LLAECFQGLSDSAQAQLLPHLHWVAVPAGGVLMRAGEPGDAMFLVVSGRLRAELPQPDGPPRRLREMGRGAIVGEIGLFTAERRTADVLAVRQTLLVRLDRERFDALVAQGPDLMAALARLAVGRLRSEARTPPWAAPRTIALESLHGSVALRSLASDLALALGRWGRVKLVEAPAPGSDFAWQLAQWEDEHEFVLLVADPDETPWTDACRRHADEILVLADVQQPLPEHAPPRVGQAARILVLRHPRHAPAPRGTAAWLDRVDADEHWHWRQDDPHELDRLARLLARQGVGVVFAGGGARGLAHLGVLRALHESGVPVDAWGGASMGAVVASLAATQAPPDRLLDVARRAFRRNPTGDFTWLPLVSLLKGQRLARSLKAAVHELMGHDAGLEDLWRPAFCVTTNYAQACEAVLRRGDLQRALRASTAIPGALPPVVIGGELHCDGGGFNNFPTDVMRQQRGIGTVLGVDLFVRKVRRLDYPDVPGPWTLLRDRWRPRARRRYPLPSLVAYLLNNTILSSLHRQPDAHRQADVLFQPPVDGIGLLHWHRLDHAVQARLRPFLSPPPRPA
jgi:NTE family protein